MPDYDIITVGGGLGGAALAKAMAERGYRVLVVEREKQFKDRVRGEWMAPWGVGEAIDLGVYDAMIRHGGHHPPGFDTRIGSASVGITDHAETTPQRVRSLTMYHPQLQEAVLEAAEVAGAEVRRGARVSMVEPGAKPVVTVNNGRDEKLSARLIVGADGRNSLVRKWGGFDFTSEDLGLQLAGILLEGVRGYDGNSVSVLNPFSQRIMFIFPQDDSGRARAYFGNRASEGVRLQGDKDVPMFFEECVKGGASPEFYADARAVGPLATFSCIYEWTGEPYQSGIALVGDAATTSDQTWGQGLSLTLGAVRRLRDALTASDNWSQAPALYNASMRSMWHSVRDVERWYTTVFMGSGPEAEAARQRVLPSIAQDPDRIPATLTVGPDYAPATDEARRRFFGED
jgi:2-polyprenyl-6-methoxyphenol hydroxylase-like FAD-dependent oxidoreductase